MAMPTLPPDFREFLKLLNDHRVRYLLIGGYAVGFHGYVRSTVDMDVWIAVSRATAQKLMGILQEFGFTAGDLDERVFLKENRIIRMGVPPLRLEIHTGISGVQFADCYRRRVKAVWDGIPVNVIGLDDLKVNKQASGRKKDEADLENLP
jgi:predicted nucleotidyltransferase